MSWLKRFLQRRWRQIAGIGAIWLAAELAAVPFVIWQVGQRIA